MLKLSLIALFAMSMATLTIAASYMPMPTDVEGAGRANAQPRWVP